MGESDERAKSEREEETRLPIIVAEISKTWQSERDRAELPSLLSQRFQHVLNVNLERGYKLRDWRLVVTPVDGACVGSVSERSGIVETIVAVFEDVRSTEQCSHTI